ncbi:MAG: HPF/RaiA family ribosome-associated protein [Gemmataceae bacterium]|nr:HPF/RaiA family ribosome-associated protein [Gemmataceae bacterium]MDW8242153.1 HPF/RaiA family ribosome-associated protein [Thermogemmata sp.]
MQLPLQISFHNMEPDAEVEQMVRERASKLERFYERIMSCRVVIDIPHRHHKNGNMYQIRLDITVPGGEIAVSREAPGHTPAKALPIAIKEAFEAAIRQLEDHVRKLRHDVKHLETQPHAKVRVVFPEQDYGFLITPDGREIYFHKNALVNAELRDLQPGTEVAYVEQMGEKGPQASTVRVVGRHGHQ